MTIGNRISELRKAKGLTQEYIADQIGVSRQAVSKWEQDQTAPDTKNLIALARLLDTSVEYIATGLMPETANPDTSVIRALCTLSKAAFILAILVYFYGMFSGLYSETFPNYGWCVFPLYYGTSTLAVILTTVEIVSLVAGVVFVIVGYRIKKKNA